MIRGDEAGGLPELPGNAELLESSPAVGLDADAGALCSQDLGLLQHKASDPFPVESESGGEAADAAADDDDAMSLRLSHVSSFLC